ncbi:MAG: haloacid dehalogenase type II [Thermodesulfobacteria bacterium]|nr:haloacid dehalogenase type II [Thermodesulfobacteriota bacterium]
MASFALVTFDCYGTLIDWETGILEALNPFLQRLPEPPTPLEVLALYAELESQAERHWRPYKEVLVNVMVNLARRLNFTLHPGEEEALVRSLPSWPPFPETNACLKMLEERKMPWAIISNIDQDLISETLKHFCCRPALVVTAEEARAYKPHPAIFELALKKASLPPERILHVGQSLFHDIAPAKRLGFKTCWVKRPDRDPYGATPRTQADPDYVVQSLVEIPDLLEA